MRSHRGTEKHIAANGTSASSRAAGEGLLTAPGASGTRRTFFSSCRPPGPRYHLSTEDPEVSNGQLRGAAVNRLLIALGVSLIVLGLGWSQIRRWPLFHLPGDIVIDRPGFKFFFPITTMLLISALISLIAWVMRR